MLRQIVSVDFSLLSFGFLFLSIVSIAITGVAKASRLVRSHYTIFPAFGGRPLPPPKVIGTLLHKSSDSARAAGASTFVA